MFDDLSYELRPLPEGACLKALGASFERLPLDHYVEGSFRRRRLSRFRGSGKRLRHLRHAAFVQNTKVNQLLGNIRRDYEELEDSLIESSAFQSFICGIQDFYGFDVNSTVLGVHQIRIVCSEDQQGEPAPEGIHQDGFDFLTIACIDRQGVLGAATQLFRTPDAKPFFSEELAPGQWVHCDDRAVYHYTTPIRPAHSTPGHRDVFVVTARLGVAE